MKEKLLVIGICAAVVIVTIIGSCHYADKKYKK